MEKLMQQLHDYLDDLNAANGNENELCLLCHSKTYNSKVGIIHEDWCLIKQLRCLPIKKDANQTDKYWCVVTASYEIESY